MPIFEYECVSCGQIDEVLMLDGWKKFREWEKRYPRICGECGGMMISIISQFSIMGKTAYTRQRSKTEASILKNIDKSKKIYGG